jgi:hypothetical protein
VKKVDVNIFEHNWIKLPSEKLKKLKALKEKIAKKED